MDFNEKMKIDENDLDLKLRMMRFLWYNGHFTRRNINLFGQTYGKRNSQQYTDIDVFTLKINEKFKTYTTICYCKSERNKNKGRSFYFPNKNKERIFTLSGIMNYVDADQGIFFKTEIDEKKYLNLAKKLKITLLSESRLFELEEAYKIRSNPYIGAFNKDILYDELTIFENLKINAKKVYNYIFYKYWIDPVQKQINSLIQSQIEISKLNSINTKEKDFLQIYLLSLLALSFLRFSESILIYPNKEREFYINESLLEGEIESSEKKKLFDDFYIFMAEEIKRRYNKVYPLKKEEFQAYLQPSYSKYIIDLTERLCLDPINAIQVPRLLDIIAYEFILNDEIKNTENKLFSYNNSFEFSSVIKLTKDFLFFSRRVGFMDEDRFNRLNELVSKM